MNLLALFFTLIALASGGHGEAPPADAHGGGHGEEKKVKKDYLPYALEGADKCKVPESHKEIAPDCGTPEYRQYLKDVEAYNDCVKPFETRILLPLRSCTKPKAKPGPDVKKLLDVP